MLFTLDTSHLERSPLNDDAKWNRPHTVITLDTSHLEMSPMNLSAPGTPSRLNIMLISVTADTSHDPIGPCGPLEQSFVLDNFRQSLMAAWSCAPEVGAHPAVEYYCRRCTVVVVVGWHYSRVRVSDTVQLLLVRR